MPARTRKCAKLITADVDERDREFITGERTAEGFYRLKPGTGLAHCIKRGIAFAKYADLIWWETSTPNLDEAREFAEAMHKVYPDKMLAYNCSPVVQLGSQHRQGHDRKIPARNRRDGL